MAGTENDAATPSANTSNTLMDNFENAFQNCLSILIKDDNFNTQDKDDIRAHAEASVQQFMECARHLEQSFLQKRLLLSIHRPDWVVKEDTQELKMELGRKDDLIRKNQDKIGMWKNMLSDVQPLQRPTDVMVLQDGQRVPTPGGGGMPQGMQFRAGPGFMARGPAPPFPGGPPGGHQGNLPGHLAYLEKTTSNIGMQDGMSGPR